jgi:hypothetical protein
MTPGRAIQAGSGRALRLDPATLPVCYTTGDARADERMRLVELDRERVVVRRAVRGIPMRLSLKVSEFLGVAIRVLPPDTTNEGAVAVMLEHRDEALSVPLMVSTGPEGDVVAEWQRWGRVLGRPLLIADGEGFREPFERLGAVRVSAPQPRRRTRGALRRRRPSILMRRKPGRPHGEPQVHRDEREIIARH